MIRYTVGAGLNPPTLLFPLYRNGNFIKDRKIKQPHCPNANRDGHFRPGVDSIGIFSKETELKPVTDNPALLNPEGEEYWAQATASKGFVLTGPGG